MLLQRLREYTQRPDLPAAIRAPTLYGEAAVRYVLDLDGSGRLLNAEPIDTSDPSSPRTKRGQLRLVPQVQRSSGIKPLLLASNSEYSLGLPRDEAKKARVEACHRSYLELLDRCAATTKEPAVEAVRRFLNSDPVSHLRLPDDFDRGATITFVVDGVFPVDLPAVQAFWAAENDPDADPDRPAPVM